MHSVCGLDCEQCQLKDTCKGCVETGGRPFEGGGQCPLAACCFSQGHQHCDAWGQPACQLKARLIAEFNALGIPDMPKVTGLNTLPGSYINQVYPLPNGETVRFWKDEKIYLGNQLEKIGGGRCYGIVADENYLLVCEYGENGADPEIGIFKKRSVV